MLSWLKAKVLKLAEVVHREPYQEFTRPFFPADPNKSLANITKEAESDFEDFKIFGGRIAVNYLMRDGFTDTGDQAIWHGFYTAMQAWKYAVTQSREDALKLETYVDGLRLHQPTQNDGIFVNDITKYGSILCRGVRESDLAIQWDASNDSACGHLAGLWWAWQHGTYTIKVRTSNLMSAWASDILYHEGALVNPTGKITRYGGLDQGIKTDPLRITLLMAIYGAAYRMTGSGRFFNAAQRTASSYRHLIPWGKTRIFSIDNHADTHRAAVQLRIMSECAAFEVYRKEIREGMDRLFDIGYKQENAWICLMAGQYISPYPTNLSFDWWVKGVLSEFSVEKKKWNVTVDNVAASGDRTIDFIKNDGHDGFTIWLSQVKKWGHQLVALNPLPIWARGSQDFVWQRHPYSVRDWSGQTRGDTRHNCGDFLAIYWLARHIGLVKEND